MSLITSLKVLAVLSQEQSPEAVKTLTSCMASIISTSLKPGADANALIDEVAKTIKVMVKEGAEKMALLKTEIANEHAN